MSVAPRLQPAFAATFADIARCARIRTKIYVDIKGLHHRPRLETCGKNSVHTFWYCKAIADLLPRYITIFAVMPSILSCHTLTVKLVQMLLVDNGCSAAGMYCVSRVMVLPC